MGALAVLIAFLVSARGIGGPFPDGHYASNAVFGTAAFNTWKWSTWLPIEVYLDHPPSPSLAYMHHPLPLFWVIAVLCKVFGFHDWVIRLPQLFYVTTTTALLFAIGRALWGAIPGGLCALAYVALPMTVGFANYYDLEQPVMFGIVLATWGYLRFVTTWRERYAAASLFGFVYALNMDWPGYMWGAAFLGGLFVYAFLIPERLRAPAPGRQLGRYWALMCTGAVLSLVLAVALVAHSGRYSDVLGSYAYRSGGGALPLRVILNARRYRIELMFTALGIGLGKLALPVIGLRAGLRRSHLELLPLPILFCALVQYLVFKEGADVHIFWPHYFAAYFPLAVGALAASVAEITVWASARLRPRLDLARLAPWVALVLIGLPVAFVLKDGLSVWRLARETGGRFAEVNLDTDLDKEAVLRWFLSRFPPNVGVAYHPAIHDGWALQWELRPRLSAGNQGLTGPVNPATRVYILDTRLASLAEMRLAASRYHVHAVGYLWVFDRGEGPAPLDGYALDERQPTWFESWWLGPTEPIRAVRADPWVTWEWRTLLGQPAAVPATPPETTDELRIAHNAALERGDADAAARLRSELQARFNLPLAARFVGGTELIGGIQQRGARRSATVFFVAGTFTRDARFSIQAKVTAPPRFSTLPADPAVLEIAGGPTWPTSLWRPGEIYSLEAVYRKRPGTEVLTGKWVPEPARADRSGPVEILVL